MNYAEAAPVSARRMSFGSPSHLKEYQQVFPNGPVEGVSSQMLVDQDWELRRRNDQKALELWLRAMGQTVANANPLGQAYLAELDGQPPHEDPDFLANKGLLETGIEAIGTILQNEPSLLDNTYAQIVINVGHDQREALDPDIVAFIDQVGVQDLGYEREVGQQY